MATLTDEQLNLALERLSEVRKPTKWELLELIKYCMDKYEHTDFNCFPFPEFVAAFPDYMTDSPGYCGKLLVVVWGGGEGFVQSFRWTDGKIEEVENEFVLIPSQDEIGEGAEE